MFVSTTSGLRGGRRVSLRISCLSAFVAPRSLVKYHDFYRGRGVAQGRLRRSAEARLLRGCPPRPVGRDGFHGSLPPSGQRATGSYLSRSRLGNGPSTRTPVREVFEGKGCPVFMPDPVPAHLNKSSELFLNTQPTGDIAIGCPVPTTNQQYLNQPWR